MAFASSHELWDGRGGTGSFPNRRTYTRVFEAHTTAAGDGPNVPVNGIGIGQGAPHPEDAPAVVVAIDPQQSAESPTMWRVTYTYDSHPDVPETLQPGAEEGDTPQAIAEDMGDNPLLRPATWRISYEQSAEVARRGYFVNDLDVVDPTDSLIVNSALLPFDPPASMEVSRAVVLLTVNRASFTLADSDAIIDTVNDDTWQGITRRKVRVIGVAFEPIRENGVSFVRVQYTLAIRRDTWDLRILDAGTRKKISGSPPRWEVIRDNFGNAAEPVPLNGSGLPLEPGSTEKYRRYSVYPTANFAALIL